MLLSISNPLGDSIFIYLKIVSSSSYFHLSSYVSRFLFRDKSERELVNLLKDVSLINLSFFFWVGRRKLGNLGDYI